ncbi:hypothetical protein [Maricaulis salignorans]|uniref:hypothetical protein n=1 Tax=Maricaulis salignorans TaxID=144026 RepID=UPI001F3C363D|nr:hypothetical protein [Maricaulis salignorans]
MAKIINVLISGKPNHMGFFDHDIAANSGQAPQSGSRGEYCAVAPAPGPGTEPFPLPTPADWPEQKRRAGRCRPALPFVMHMPD